MVTVLTILLVVLLLLLGISLLAGKFVEILSKGSFVNKI